jgi:hypothetical protein
MTEDPLEAFYALSSELTGFSIFELKATGVGDSYFGRMSSDVGAETLATLFRVWAEIVREGPHGNHEREVEERIFGADDLRPAAQRLIMLWYVGSWYYVRPFTTQVLSSQSYIEGLMWKAIRSHPMAAKPQGYGAWALDPPAAS